MWQANQLADVWTLVSCKSGCDLVALSINRRSAWQSCDLVAAVSINRGSAAGDQRVTATQRGLVGDWGNLGGVAGGAGWCKGTCIPALPPHSFSIVFYTCSCLLLDLHNVLNRFTWWCTCILGSYPRRCCTFVW